MRKQTLSKREKKLRMVGYASLGMLGLVSLLALCPIVSQETNAADTIDVSLNYGSLISVAVDPAVDMQVGTAVEAFTSGTANLTVATNNQTGYSIFMSPVAEGETSLVSTKVPDEKIPSITGDTLGSDMTGNVWGYTIGNEEASVDSTYHSIPTSNNIVIQNTASPSTNTGDKYKLGFGAHVDTSLRPGTYTNQLVISALAKHVPPVLDEIDTMQQMTSAICSNSPFESQRQLVDERDGKTYYVAHLKDGKCWMTQNLAYEFKKLNDDGSQRYLTPEDSDVDEDWAIPGDMLTIGMQSDMTPTSTNMWKGNEVTNGHDSVGNYYSWGAATAGSGIGMTTGDAPSSICPKGWRLPTSSSAGGDFKNLTDAYGIESSLAGVNAIQAAPFFVVRSGLVSGTSLNYMGMGYLRSSTTAGSEQPYWSYNFSVSSTSSTNIIQNKADQYAARYNGLPVRCIAK